MVSEVSVQSGRYSRSRCSAALSLFWSVDEVISVMSIRTSAPGSVQVEEANWGQMMACLRILSNHLRLSGNLEKPRHVLIWSDPRFGGR